MTTLYNITQLLKISELVSGKKEQVSFSQGEGF